MLLNNRIDYQSVLKYIDVNSTVNLRWLKSLNNNCDLKQTRENNYLKFPIEKVLLVEGLTEEILLPAFSKYLGYDFYQKGIQIIPAGGKNQVVKMYYSLSEELRLPIYLLLDKDAEENIRQIEPKLRKIDKIHLVSCGEFEDLLSKSLIVKTVNSLFKNFIIINSADLDSELSMAKQLEEIFRIKGLHEFKKVEFAKIVRENISENSDVSEEIRDIIREISI
jgi:predicted ATP-dependent endonuclease of OLD family